VSIRVIRGRPSGVLTPRRKAFANIIYKTSVLAQMCRGILETFSVRSALAQWRQFQVDPPIRFGVC